MDDGQAAPAERLDSQDCGRLLRRALLPLAWFLADVACRFEDVFGKERDVGEEECDGG